MKTDELRERFLQFFKKHGHKIVPSDSLVPQNDPTLLFTGAGMNQFKENFLGIKKDLKRAASSQKCLRTGDLDEVGRTPYHHSFFEMLGNFSFGDYFKKEAIHWAWDLLTVELGIQKDRLRVSVYKDDKEAYKIWEEEIKIRPGWIYPMGEKSNFWPSNAPQEGPDGPCGPCSEIYYDQDPDSRSEDIEGARFAEIWNLVFTQFDRQEGGRLVPLAQKNIDTGMGLERLACVMQGKKTNFETDIFQPVHQAIEAQLKIRVPKKEPKSLYAISDHLRAVVFAMADGVIPANEGRGYVIRKLIRRALWHAHQLVPERRVEAPFLYLCMDSVVEGMGKAYPELHEAEASIRSMLQGEENRFLATLETGLAILEEKLSGLKKGQKYLPGEIVFELYDTYGFPDELTRHIAHEKGFEIDQAGFDRLMKDQRHRAKQSSQIATSIFVSTELEKKIAGLPPTKFLGYQTLKGEGRVLFEDIQGKGGIVVLDETPFYAESGGQVGDQGWLESDSFKAHVTDTKKKDSIFLHAVEIEKGSLKPGDRVRAEVDRLKRESAMRHHTATHLLHAALRQILGKQVRQLGSLVSPEKLRFDYSYGQALTAGQLKEIEDLVNEEILKNTAVSKEEKGTEEARKEGAIAFFGEKYGDRVRVVTVPGFSKEFCGGTHCDRTGQIGSFLIVSDTSIGSGTRRIEALTGLEALNYARTIRDQIAKLAESVKASPAELESRISKMRDTIKKLEKGGGAAAVHQNLADEIIQNARAAGRFKFTAQQVEGVSLEGLRQLSDRIRSKASQTVYLLAAQVDEKVYFLLGMSPDLRTTDLDLLKLFGELSGLLKASGGGRKDLVQGGGASRAVLEEKNWNAVSKIAINYLETFRPER